MIEITVYDLNEGCRAAHANVWVNSSRVTSESLRLPEIEGKPDYSITHAVFEVMQAECSIFLQL